MKLPESITSRADYWNIERADAIKNLITEYIEIGSYLFYNSQQPDRKNSIIPICIKTVKNLVHMCIIIDHDNGKPRYNDCDSVEEALARIKKGLLEKELINGSLIPCPKPNLSDTTSIKEDAIKNFHCSTTAHLLTQLPKKETLLSFPRGITALRQFCLINEEITRDEIIELVKQQNIGDYLIYQSLSQPHTSEQINLSICIKIREEKTARHAITIKNDNGFTFNSYNKYSEALENLTHLLIKKSGFPVEGKLNPIVDWRDKLENLRNEKLAQKQGINDQLSDNDETNENHKKIKTGY